jgi:hypothetical protein
MMCKVNIAAYDKIILPHESGQPMTLLWRARE